MGNALKVAVVLSSLAASSEANPPTIPAQVAQSQPALAAIAAGVVAVVVVVENNKSTSNH